MNDMMHIVKFDKTPKLSVEAHQLVNYVVVQGLTLYNDGYRLRPCIVRGRQSMALDAPGPGEFRSDYRSVAHGLKALQLAYILSRPVRVENHPVPLENGRHEDEITSYMSPWKLDSDGVHDHWTECGTYEPDFHDNPDIWAYGY